MNKKIKRILLRSSIMIVGLLFILCGNSIAQISVDLSTHVTGTSPTGVVIEWHNATPASAASKLTAAQVLAAPAGTYYATYHDTVNNCYSPESRVVAATNNCPTSTVDLTTKAGNAPPLTTVQWYTNSVHTGTAYSTPQTASAGTYYAFFYDVVNMCYSPASNPVIIFTGSCATPDTLEVTPPCIGCPVTACVIADDIDTTGGGVSYSACSAPVGYTQTGPDANGCVTLTPNLGTSTGGQSCVVACKNGICDTTIINILPPVTPDTLPVTPPCIGCPVTACVIADDIDTTGGGVSYSACSAPVGYTQTGPDANGCVTLTPNLGTSTGGQSCVVACKNGICDTTIINILPPVTPDTIATRGQCDTCSTIEVCATANDLPSGSGAVTYSSCGVTPSGFGAQVLNSLTGCLIFTGNGTQGANDTLLTCIVACKNGICDTSYISILPPVQTDSIMTVLPACGTCPTAPICPSANDLLTTSNMTYINCGLDANEMSQGTLSIDSNGCAIWTPNGNQVDTITTCVIACAGGLCDTTYISIPSTVSPLPIVFNDFTVLKNKCSAHLNWSTISELNTAHFNIMRKGDHDLFYRNISVVEAAGNSSNLRHYQYIDRDLENGTYLYKLEIVDIDNSLSESVTRSIRINCNVSTVSVFPNPASNKLNVRISSVEKKQFAIKLSDLAGRTILKTRTTVDKGSETVQLPVQSVSNGIYQVTVTNGKNKPEVFKVHIRH